MGRNQRDSSKKGSNKSSARSGNKARNNKRKRPDTQKPSQNAKRAKLDKPTPQPPQHAESDEELLPEDEKFFMEHGEYLSILDNMTPAAADGPQKKRRKQKEEVETAYESAGPRRNRDWEDDKKKPSKLPLKVGGSIVAPVPTQEPEEEAGSERADELEQEEMETEEGIDGEVYDDEEGSEVEELDLSDMESDSDAPRSHRPRPASQPKEEDNPEDLSPEELELHLFMKRQEKISNAKQQIAVLASSVLEDPEEHLGKLKELHKLCNEEDATIKKLAILSELAVFKDIIPSYRIQAEDEEQSGVKLSKDVKKLRDHEHALLKAYQRYLRTLEEFVKKALGMDNNGRKMRKKQKREMKEGSNAPQEVVDMVLFTKMWVGIAAAAVRAMGELLSTHYHFNFRSNLITALVPVMDCQHDELAALACDYMKQLFRNDSKGSCALEAVRAIAQLVRVKNYTVRPEILSTFLALPLSTEMSDDVDIFDQKPQKSSKKHLSKKQKKERKEQKALEKEMQQAAAEQSREEKARIQTETLKALFLLYFKVLKNMQKSPLLAPVLEGLARYAHLINMDLLSNVLQLLKDLVAKNKLSLVSSLHCIVTAFQAFKMQGETLEVDLKDFYSHFYKILFDIMSTVSQHKELLPLLLRALDLMLTNRRLFAVDRTAAYIKRLLMLSLQAPPNAIMAILKVVYDLLRKYPKTQQLLDSEFTGSGLYLPELDDPEHCNAFASTAWELIAILHHYHPAVAKFGELTIKAEPLTISSTSHDLFKQYSFAKNFYVPPPQKPKEHPLYKTMEKSSKKGRTQMYFIEPERQDDTEFLRSIKAKSAISDESARTSLQRYFGSM